MEYIKITDITLSNKILLQLLFVTHTYTHTMKTKEALELWIILPILREIDNKNQLPNVYNLMRKCWKISCFSLVTNHDSESFKTNLILTILKNQQMF